MSDETSGCLDGITILRFAHAYEGGAGLEYDVESIIRCLSERSRLTTVYVRMCRTPAEEKEAERPVGRGRLIEVPIYRPPVPAANGSPAISTVSASSRVYGFVGGSWVVPNWVFRLGAHIRRPPPRSTDIPTAGSKVRELLDRFKPDIIMLHSIGGRDADEIIRHAKRRGIPVVLQLHYANERYAHFSIRCQVVRASGVSGVSDLRVPAYLRNRFSNLLTGLSLAEFTPRSILPGESSSTPPALLLPARIVPSKGHEDLVKAAAYLRDRGISFQIIFCGRLDDVAFAAHLRTTIAKHKLEKEIAFRGLLSQSEMRECYASCAILAFPTYHFEGLPRVVLEAQAMALPAVVYDSGGTAAALTDGVSGFVLRRGDITGLAKRLQQLLLDPVLRREMGRQGRAILAFPTYHFEGLPRVVLEAQAMALPAVVYDSGKRH